MVFNLREFPVYGDVDRKMNPHVTVSAAILQSENEEAEEVTTGTKSIKLQEFFGILVLDFFFFETMWLGNIS